MISTFIKSYILHLLLQNKKNIPFLVYRYKVIKAVLNVGFYMCVA